MNLIQAIILGLVQGLTEFIPVSSSGHLLLLPEIFGWPQQSTAFDIVLHGGTLLALIVFYRKQLWMYLVNPKQNQRELKFIAIATIPPVIFGASIAIINKSTNGSLNEIIKNPYLSIFMLILIGVLFFIADRSYHNNHKDIRNLSSKNSIFIGLLQSLSLIRGTSRSGITILAGQSRGLSRKNAADFSFLVGIPILTIGFTYELFDLASNPSNGEAFQYLIVGFIVSFVSGILAIKFLLKFLQNNGLSIFGAYRIILGLIVLAILIL